MPRRRADSPVDLSRPHDLTVGLISSLRCPDGKQQAFLRDLKSPGLRVRVTAHGAKAFVFESKVNGRTLRQTIGSAQAWSIDEARAKANELRVLIDQDTDPRDLKRQQEEEQARALVEAQAQAVANERALALESLTVGAVWDLYLAERRPYWGERSYADHLSMADPGGRPRRRLNATTTKPGPLAALMTMRLLDLDQKAIEIWAADEAKTRPARVRLALRLLKAFLRWAAAEPNFAGIVAPAAASSKRARDAAGRARAKDDVLERGQLQAWFKSVRGIANQVTAAYLQTLLLTGARPGEISALRWDDINTQWRSIVIRDKVEGERQIPLTPYVWSLLAGLPRRNEWVFSSSRVVSLKSRHIARRERYHSARGTVPPAGGVVQVSKSGRITDPDIAHRRACTSANLGGLTLHGLRRSFASLTEWLEVPAGVVAQIQGHKPSATAEKHYKRRPLDLLRVHHERIEAWILDSAGVEFVTDAPERRLEVARQVAG